MSAEYISEIIFDNKLNMDSYLWSLPVVKYLSENNIRFSSPVTLFVGENGTGKSTLLEGIAVAAGFNPEGGTKNFSFSTQDSHSEIYGHLTVVKKSYAKHGFFLRAESLYNTATHIDRLDSIPASAPKIIDSYGGVSLHNMSHGESFMSIIQSRKGDGLYILDEPESALSPMSILKLIVEIDRLVKSDSQFIIATHSPILMAFPNAEILQLSENGIESVDYRDTEHYRTTKGFLDSPERYLHLLLD